MSGSASLMTDQQVKNYVQQWHSQQESINRLTEMESDLKLLITALAMNTPLDENPASLRQKIVAEQHGEKQTMTTPQKNITENITENTDVTSWADMHSLATKTAIGAQLGWYAKPELVKTKVKKLKSHYPQAFNSFHFTMFEKHNVGTTLYGLRAGPFKNTDEAKIFCYLAEKMAQTCSPAPFLGEVI
ncbi:SPOR domain-containing protein [Pseudoalteromonas sp. MMG010]|nr:SPOR domain-containing protein [Pseudoalteromonas sp. MMG010]